MPSISDLGLALVQKSQSFQLQTNFEFAGPFQGDPTQGFLGVKRPTIDEFIRVLPFSHYDIDILSGIVASRPSAVEPEPAFLPGLAPGELSINNTEEAFWYWPGAVPGYEPTVQYYLETEVDGVYETFTPRRIAAIIELDKMQEQLVQQRGKDTKGTDPIPALIHAASAGVVRVLSRTAINNVDSGQSGESIPPFRMYGLAKYYDDQFGGAGNDPQVVKADSPLTLAQVRALCRRVSPGEDGFGLGPNALLMSWRTRDLLIELERAQGCTPAFLLDARTGTYRYHFEGVPVYVGPVREDELDTGDTPDYPIIGNPPSPYLYNKTSIYAMRLGGISGVRLLHVGGDSTRYGLQVEEIAVTVSTPARGYKVHGFYTLFIPDRQAVARLWGVDISSVS